MQIAPMNPWLDRQGKHPSDKDKQQTRRNGIDGGSERLQDGHKDTS
jgi:hypothetical protein